MSFLLTTDRRILDYLKQRFDNQETLYDGRPIQLNTVHNLDACEFLRTLPSNSIDFICTDEPFGTAPTRLNLKASKDITTDFEWDKIIELPEVYRELLWGKGNEAPRLPTSLLTEWVFEAERVLKDNGFLINFGQQEFVTPFKDVCRYAGLTWKASIPWIKMNTAPHFRKANFRSGHETILFACKGKTKGEWNFQEQQEMINFVIDQRCPNCNASFPVIFSNNYDFPKWYEQVENWVEISPMTNKKTGHPTEKPEWLITKLILIMSRVGQVVVDPFAGSGVTAIVANRLGRKYIVNDLSTEYADAIKKRLENQPLTIV